MDHIRKLVQHPTCTALQIAKARGFRVFGTSRTPAKLEGCKKLGLDIAINTGEIAGDEIDQGLLPTSFSRPPHGAMAGLAFVVRRPMHPARAAMRVKYIAVPK